MVNYAISALHSLLSYQEGAKMAVRLAGGIQRMTPLLKTMRDDPRFLAVDADCLHMMAFGDDDAKLAIWNCKGPQELVAILRNRATAGDEKLVWTVSRLLKGESGVSRLLKG